MLGYFTGFQGYWGILQEYPNKGAAPAPCEPLNPLLSLRPWNSVELELPGADLLPHFLHSRIPGALRLEKPSRVTESKQCPVPSPGH